MCIAQHRDVAQGDRRTQPGSRRLGKGFLGGKTLGQKARRVAAGVIPGMLGRGEDAVGIVFAEARETAADALGVQQVGADTVDHNVTLTGKPAVRIFSAKASSHSMGSADRRLACGCIDGRASPYSSTPCTGIFCARMRLTAAR